MLQFYSTSIIYFTFSLFFITLSLISLFKALNFLLLDLSLFIEWELFYSTTVTIVFTMLFDWMSLLFLSTVTFISSMVMIYSYSYMSMDSGSYRFSLMVFLFVVSMMLMILSPNMISILLGWDGLGLVSYALVVFYQNVKSSNAGMLTVLSNRVGDVAILVSIAWLFNYGVWDFFTLQMAYSEEVISVMALIGLASLTKSAQMPFSAWLPAAMAAPTPVSSLVHSSTLVTAGVYLLIRFNYLLGLSKILLFISVLTLFMSGLSANFEYDLKKIIALSTLSQLGVMMMTLSLGGYEMAFFHLISHAMFKSLLFLCAGFYIHSMSDSQDIRLLGKVSYSFPVVSLLFMGCSLSLCGFPFLSGFYSKDLILESLFFHDMNILIYMLSFMGMMFTFTYSIRLVYYLIWGDMKVVKLMAFEGDYFMLAPMTFLFSVSVVVGSFYVWEFLPVMVPVLPFFIKISVILLGIFLSFFILFIMFFKKHKVTSLSKNNLGINLKKFNVKIKVGSLMQHMWFLSYISSILPTKLLNQGVIYIKSLDHGWLEHLGGQGVMGHFMAGSSLVDKWNSLSFKIHLFLSVLLVIFIFFFI